VCFSDLSNQAYLLLRSFKAFLLIVALFLVVLVALYVVPDDCYERRIDVRLL
jgi:hypothetical protein